MVGASALMLFGTVLWSGNLHDEQLKLPRFRPRQSWVSPDEILAWIAFGSALPITLWDTRLFSGASLWPHFGILGLQVVLSCISRGEPLPFLTRDEGRAAWLMQTVPKLMSTSHP
jgi:hypothetical protein